jgi:hypothetical protein
LKDLLDETKQYDLGELMLDFTLPGYPEFELMENGSNFSVTNENVQEYVDLVIDATIGNGVQEQIKAFKEGFERFIPTHFFDCFTVDEIGLLVGGEEHDNWSKQGIGIID